MNNFLSKKLKQKQKQLFIFAQNNSEKIINVSIGEDRGYYCVKKLHIRPESYNIQGFYQNKKIIEIDINMNTLSVIQEDIFKITTLCFKYGKRLGEVKFD